MCKLALFQQYFCYSIAISYPIYLCVTSTWHSPAWNSEGEHFCNKEHQATLDLNPWPGALPTELLWLARSILQFCVTRNHVKTRAKPTYWFIFWYDNSGYCLESWTVVTLHWNVKTLSWNSEEKYYFLSWTSIAHSFTFDTKPIKQVIHTTTSLSFQKGHIYHQSQRLYVLR